MARQNRGAIFTKHLASSSSKWKRGYPVNVEEFQLHLSNLSNLLRRAGGKKVADEFDEVCAGLQPYRDRRLKDLLGMISEAEAIIRNGPPAPKSAGRGKKKANPLEVAQAINRV